MDELTDPEADEEFLRETEEIGDFVGEIDLYDIYDWELEGQTRGTFEAAGELEDLDPEDLDELLKIYKESREEIEEGYRRF